MKLIIKSIIVCGVIAVGLYFTYSKKEVTPLLLENIEALANGETGENWVCVGYGSVDCPNGTKVEKVFINFSLPHE